MLTVCNNSPFGNKCCPLTTWGQYEQILIQSSPVWTFVIGWLYISLKILFYKQVYWHRQHMLQEIMWFVKGGNAYDLYHTFAGFCHFFTRNVPLSSIYVLIACLYFRLFQLQWRKTSPGKQKQCTEMLRNSTKATTRCIVLVCGRYREEWDESARRCWMSC